MELAMPMAPPKPDPTVVNIELDVGAQENAAINDNTASNNQPTPSVDLQYPQPAAMNNENALQYPAVDIAFDVPSEAAGNARDLSPADWRVVMETNSLLYGFHIREVNQDVVRARQNAFVLKRSDQTSDNQPYYQVEDGSSIQVQETKNFFQRSLAKNAFSKRCIESNLSVGDFGIMAGLSGEQEHEKAGSDGSQKAWRNQEYYAVFNFPRARLLLDEEELQLSEKCQAALTEIQKQQSFEGLQRFYKLFGHVFVTSVLLGGQQKTSKFAAALGIENEEVQQDALRGAIGAKINSPYVSTSTQLFKERGTNRSRNDQNFTNLSSLGMSASGGNTLIGSDIPSWAHTVAPFKNWRVIENEVAEPIHDLIGKLSGWGHIPGLFKVINDSRPAAHRPWRERLSLLMDGQPLCWKTENGMLYLGPSKDKDSRRAIFGVSPAERREYSKSEGPTEFLKPDSPLFLNLNAGPELDPEGSESLQLGIEPAHEGWGKFAPQSAKVGCNCPCRFSLRFAGQSGPWNPKPTLSRGIKSGDQVNLYCHSLGLGPFANLRRPPSYASPALCVPGSPALLFASYNESFSPTTRELIIAYEKNTLSSADQEAFEKMGIISTKDFAPGPNVIDISKSSEFSFTTSRMGITQSKETMTQYSVVGGKKVRVDYKLLQKEPFRSAPFEWGRCQRQVAESAFGRGSSSSSTRRASFVSSGIAASSSLESFLEPTIPKPVTLTVVYE